MTAFSGSAAKESRLRLGFESNECSSCWSRVLPILSFGACKAVSRFCPLRQHIITMSEFHSELTLSGTIPSKCRACNNTGMWSRGTLSGISCNRFPTFLNAWHLKIAGSIVWRMPNYSSRFGLPGGRTQKNSQRCGKKCWHSTSNDSANTSHVSPSSFLDSRRNRADRTADCRLTFGAWNI